MLRYVAPQTVVCLKTGAKYGHEYVNKLYSSVSRWAEWKSTPEGLRFVCVTDNPDGISAGIEVMPLLPPILPGWWNKLQLFHPDGAFQQIKGRVLYLDLDVIITGPLDELVDYPSDFVMHLDFQKPWKCASAVMLLEAGSRPWIWEWFITNSASFMRNMHGDQDCIQQITEIGCRSDQPNPKPAPDFFPQRWVRNYKQYGVSGPPKDCRVMCFNGEPKMSDITSGWVKDAWV